MNNFFFLTLLLFLSIQSKGQSYTLYFFEHFDNAGDNQKDTFVMCFNKNFITLEYLTKKPVNKIILDLKSAKQYIILDTKKIVFYADTIKQDASRNHVNVLAQKKEIDTLYFGFKSKFYCDTLITEDYLGNTDTLIKKNIYASKWPFNLQNYFVTINILGFFEYPKGCPIYSYSKSSSNSNFIIEEFESGIYKIEKSKKKSKTMKINLPKNYTYKKLTYENIEAVLLNK